MSSGRPRTMKKSRLLLFDANVVILLFKLGIWEQVIARCDVLLSRTVAQIEADYYETDEGERRDIDLATYVKAGQIRLVDISPSDLAAFRGGFDAEYFERLDAGETESLVYLLNSLEQCLVCSSDKIVYRVLGNLRRSGQGVSLEEVLASIGLGRSLPHQFGKAYREKWSSRGFQESMWDRGSRDRDDG